jgi:hypothetical protein
MRNPDNSLAIGTSNPLQQKDTSGKMVRVGGFCSLSFLVLINVPETLYDSGVSYR